MLGLGLGLVNAVHLLTRIGQVLLQIEGSHLD